METFWAEYSVEIIAALGITVLSWIGLSLKKTRQLIYEARESLTKCHTELITEMKNHNDVSKDSIDVLRQLQIDAAVTRKDHEIFMQELKNLSK